MAHGGHDSETGDERIFFNGLEIASQRQGNKCARQSFPLNRDQGLKKKPKNTAIDFLKMHLAQGGSLGTI